MEQNWSYLINQFLTSTEKSYRKMKQVGDYTLSALTAAAASATDPDVKAFFTQLVSILTPFTNIFDDGYIRWQSKQGIQKGQTKGLNDLLDDLRGIQIQAWDRAIQNLYLPGTSQYITLLPRHRTPFQTGSQQDRISAVGALELLLEDDPNLKSLLTQVKDTYDDLVAANATQKGSKSTKSGSSKEVETDRVALAVALYGVLGMLMNRFQDNPAVIAPYFLIEVIQRREQTEFHHAIDGGETRLAITRTHEEGEKLVLGNDGDTDLQFTRVASKETPMPTDAFTLVANTTEAVLPETLGEEGNRYLIVKNVSPTEKGNFTIKLI